MPRTEIRGNTIVTITENESAETVDGLIESIEWAKSQIVLWQSRLDSALKKLTIARNAGLGLRNE